MLMTPEQMKAYLAIAREADLTSQKLSHEMHGYNILANADEREAMDKQRAVIHAIVDLQLDSLDKLAALRRQVEV